MGIYFIIFGLIITLVSAITFGRKYLFKFLMDSYGVQICYDKVFGKRWKDEFHGNVLARIRYEVTEGLKYRNLIIFYLMAIVVGLIPGINIFALGLLAIYATLILIIDVFTLVATLSPDDYWS